MSSKKKTTIVCDLDGTLCEQGDIDTYADVAPKLDVIKSLNWASEQCGYKVVIHTARGMNTFKGDVKKIKKKLGPLTRKWLKRHGVKYDELIFGKPAGEIYLDDRGWSLSMFTGYFRGIA